MPEMTICVDCKHFRNQEPSGPRRDVWYNHFCAASPLPKGQDPVTGKVQQVTSNDLGTQGYTDDEFYHCRDMNGGKCSKWEAA